MRVLHITRDYPPRLNGGISTAVGGMVRCCTRLGIECAVISFDAWRPRAHRAAAPLPTEAHDAVGDTAGAPVLRLSHPDQLPAAHAFADRFAPALAHVHHGMLHDFAAEICARWRAPIITQIHVLQAAQNRLRQKDRQKGRATGQAPNETPDRPTLSSTAQNRAIHASDVVVVPSRTAARALAETHPDLAAPVRVIGLGIDDSDSARAAVAQRSRKPDAALSGPVLYVGRFADINGTAELFAAIPRVLARAPEVHFVVAGGVPDNRKAERRWHRRWRDSAPESVRARVSLPGWQTRAQLTSLYGRARILVSPSWLETFGLVVLEAMLHGLPIVGTRSGGVEELLEHGRTGLLAPVRDVAPLVDHIVELLADHKRASQLGLAAAATARERHLWSHIGPDLAELYQRALRDC